MENLDILVLRQLRDWRLAGQKAMLVTVLNTWGSAPRPAGSIMALAENGSVVGSVSGGCIEDDLLHRFTQIGSRQTALGTSVGTMPSGVPRRLTYGISAQEAHQFGLPCGGTLELLMEFDPSAAQLSELVSALDAGRMVQRRLDLATGQVSLKDCATPEDFSLDDQCLCTTFGPAFRMLLIGAGALSEYLATMALFSGFEVTVCDPREEYRRTWRTSNVKLATDMPDDVVKAFVADHRSCVVALTHDPKLDDLALLEALQTPAFYIGAIGSRRNQALRRARLKTHFAQSDESLLRLRGPIGIYIGSKTPSEIAISVMAEILAVKNAVPLPRDMQVAVAKENLLALPLGDKSGNFCPAAS